MADYNSMKVPELKKLLNERSLVQTGNKAELIKRLQGDDGAKATEAGEDKTEAGKILRPRPRFRCFSLDFLRGISFTGFPPTRP